MTLGKRHCTLRRRGITQIRSGLTVATIIRVAFVVEMRHRRARYTAEDNLDQRILVQTGFPQVSALRRSRVVGLSVSH